LHRLDAVFLDADDLHSAANVAKMAAGAALDDDDRAPWLRAVGERWPRRSMWSSPARRSSTPTATCFVTPLRISSSCCSSRRTTSSPDGSPRARGTSCRRVCCARSSRPSNLSVAM